MIPTRENIKYTLLFASSKEDVISIITDGAVWKKKIS